MCILIHSSTALSACRNRSLPPRMCTCSLHQAPPRRMPHPTLLSARSAPWLARLSPLPSHVLSVPPWLAAGAVTHLGVLLLHCDISFLPTGGSFPSTSDPLFPAPSSPTLAAPSPHQCPPPLGTPNAHRSGSHGALRARLSLSPFYVAFACFNCFGSFIVMLQLNHMDVVKVD